MKKVLVLTPDINGTGGVANYYKILDLKKNHQVDYFYVNKFNSGKVVKVFLFLYRCIQLLFIAPKYSLFHLNVSLDSKSYNRDLLYSIIITLYRKPFMVFFHGWELEFEENLYNSKFQSWIFKNTLGKMIGCFVLGKIFEKKLKKMRNNPNCKYWLECPLADNEFINKVNIQQKLNEQKEELNLFFISRFVKSKGVYIIADALKILQDKNIPFNMVFSGTGNDILDFKKYVSALNLKNIIFTGDVRGKEKHEQLKRADVLFFPTYFPEGMPTVIVEAMLYGMPIVSRVNAAIPEMIEHGLNGFLSESKEPQVFVDFIIKLINTPELRKEMGLRNHLKAKELSVKEKIEERVLNAYQELLTN